MEAELRLRYLCTKVVVACIVLFIASQTDAANFRTQNFIIDAPSPQLAQAVGEAAERYRNDLAVYWTGEALRPWPAPCPVRVIAGPNLAAQGVTTYNPAPVRDFQMEVIGTPERILDSVLPHEVTHTVLATYFGRPLPRWADEGICTTVEHDSEKNKHQAKLREFLTSRRGIPMNQLFLMKEYPADVLPMYAQGYSVCQFLIAQRGPRAFVQFLTDYMQHPSWTANVRKHYKYDSLAELQKYWIDWVSNGSGPVERFAKIDQAGNTAGNGSNGSIAQVTATEPVPAGQVKRLGSIESQSSTTVANGIASVQNPAAAKGGHAKDTALLARADAESAGWYQRQRMKVLAEESQDGTARSAIRPIAPPSVSQSGRYQSAQPQEEQGISRSGQPVEAYRGGFGSGTTYLR